MKITIKETKPDINFEKLHVGDFFILKKDYLSSGFSRVFLKTKSNSCFSFKDKIEDYAWDLQILGDVIKLDLEEMIFDKS